MPNQPQVPKPESTGREQESKTMQPDREWQVVGVVGARVILRSPINGNMAAIPTRLTETLKHLGLNVVDKGDNYIL